MAIHFGQVTINKIMPFMVPRNGKLPKLSLRNDEDFEKLNGSQELGTYCIYLCFVVIASPASISLILTQALLLHDCLFYSEANWYIAFINNMCRKDGI
ncbi:hypothetical protein [Psychrobacter sp. 16-MNA-CIBAN-0192]|uniref:hypothetical protein n=1 Tax=Psychrobacter sp. 16-MNA-CIBAN-0192 TaxID=3140448 RepID=UPI003322AE56